MLEYDVLLPTLFKLLLPEFRYMGDEGLQNLPGCHEEDIYNGSA